MSDTKSAHSAESVPRLVITPGQRRTLLRAKWSEQIGDERSWWDSVRHGWRQYKFHRSASRKLNQWDAERAARIDGPGSET